MKTFLAFATISLVLWPQLLLAQAAEMIELTREVVQTERKMIVSANMAFSDEESQQFWPVYNNYQSDIREVNDRRVELVRSYLEDYDTLNDEQAEKMIREFLAIEVDRLSLKRSYIRKFKKTLSQKKVLRFYQIDNKLDTIIDFDLARGIPLAR